MSKLNRQRYIKLHKELWGWLATTGEKLKEKWPGWKWNGGKYIDEAGDWCFCCDYAILHAEENENYDIEYCGFCPITWAPDSVQDHCLNAGSDYYKWSIANTIKTRKKYAKKIRDKEWEIRRKLKPGYEL